MDTLVITWTVSDWSLTILWKEKQLYIQQLKIDEKQKLENIIQPQIEKLTKQKQEIIKMIQKDPEQYQTENFKIKLSFEIKHKNSEYWQVYFFNKLFI